MVRLILEPKVFGVGLQEGNTEKYTSSSPLYWCLGLNDPKDVGQ